MAAAEARAAWQRLANRYIVQEDAKRAPKLACCPSSSSKLQFDLGSGEGDNGSDSSACNFMLVNWNSMYPNLSPETKWWLQLQPNFGHQNDFVHEQINKVEDDCGDKTREIVNPYIELPTDANTNKNACAFQDSPCVVSATFMKNDGETKVEELKTLNSNVQWPPKHKEDFCEHWYMEDELMDWKMVDRLISTASEKDCSELKPNWSKGKTEPWWRVTDKDELSLLVAKKSLEHFENCDLPPPKRVHVNADPLTSLGRFHSNEKSHSSFDKMLHAGIYNPADHAKHSSTSQILDRELTSYDKIICSFDDSERLNRTHSYDAYPRASEHKSHTSDTDSYKAQLLEALCHSQTRAREAEIAAQKAYNEKENVIKLLFKQASHLFAYKQWLRLLQLETLYLQLKVKEQQLSTLLPSMPWTPDNDEYKKYSRKEGKKKRKCGFCRYIVAFAIGMSLASAGLLLGWTLGWLLPLI